MTLPLPQKGAAARNALREATYAVHQRLESSLRLTAPDLTRNEYLQTLGCFFSTYLALESELEKHAPLLHEVGIDWQERRKVPLLQRDLEALGQADAHGVRLTSRAEVPPLETLPQAMGCLYVLEGATLGGTLISANLRRVLGIGPESGGAFFASYGGAVQIQWQRFCVALEKSLSDVHGRQQAAASAIATFELFNACV
jgi:heme oxygenase (biliverdin-IX-beta and delta-forming)